MNKPFIIKPPTLISPDSSVYDQNLQRRVHILQAANGYLAINMFYEAFKLLWEYFHWKSECADFAYLSLGFMFLDVFWALTSIFGFKAVNKKNSRNIVLFGYSVILNIVLRVGLYIACGVVMSGYISSYILDPQQTESAICNAIYPKALFILEGVIEGIACLIILYLQKSITEYVKSWEKEETNKYLVKGFNNIGGEEHLLD